MPSRPCAGPPVAPTTAPPAFRPLGWPAVALIALIAPLAGCGSIAERRTEVVLASSRHTLALELSLRDYSAATESHLYLFDTLLWPVDALVSTWYSLTAINDDDVHVAWGPLGALGAILLPWCTARHEFHLGEFEPQPWSMEQRERRRVLLPVDDGALLRWQRGELPLDELAAQAIANSLRAVDPRRQPTAQRLVRDVAAGRAGATATGPLQDRFGPTR